MQIKYKKNNEFEGIVFFYPDVAWDKRGYFYESFNKDITDILGVSFVQDNESKSSLGVARGLHYQWDNPMGKLVRVVSGAAIDYFVDIRVDSPTFKKYGSILLSHDNKHQVWIPPGYAHGFVPLEDETILNYKCTSYYNSSGEESIDIFDRELGLDLNSHVSNIDIISDRDRKGISFDDYLIDPKFFYNKVV